MTHDRDSGEGSIAHTTLQVTAAAALLEALHDGANPREVAAVAARFARDLAGADGAAIARPAGAEVEYIGRAGRAAPSAGERAPLSGSPHESCLEEAKALLLDADHPGLGALAGPVCQSAAIVPVWSDGGVIAIVEARSTGTHRFDAGDVEALEALAEHAGRALALASARSQRMRYVEHALAEQEAERRSIARELHDGIGQSMTMILVGLRSLERLVPSEPARDLSRRLRQVALSTLEDVGRMAHGLRPSVLDDIGLVAALERHASDVERTHEIEIDLQVDGIAPSSRLPGKVETTIYRVVQEALTNVVKHAYATSASVIIEKRTDTVQLIVEDNGRGMSAAEEETRAGAGGLGLVGIRERVDSLGGSVEIEATPGRGTTLYVRLPAEVK